MRRPGLNYDQSFPLAGVGSLLLRAAGQCAIRSVCGYRP